MQVDVTFRHVKSSKALRAYAEEKLEKAKKYLSEPITAHVVLEVERDRHRARVDLSAHGATCQGEATTVDLYAAIDGVMDKIEKQLKRRKDRNGRHHGLPHHGALEQLNGSSRPSRGNGVSRRRTANNQGDGLQREGLMGKPMGIEEALLEFRQSKTDFFVFRNDESNEINVLYRRKGGGFGLIDPSY